MSERNLYCIRDTIAEETGPIFEAKNDSVAWRNYLQIIKGTPCPGDFLLYRVGTFNGDDMLFTDLVAVNVSLSMGGLRDEAI